jgi:hypothetical protein
MRYTIFILLIVLTGLLLLFTNCSSQREGGDDPMKLSSVYRPSLDSMNHNYGGNRAPLQPLSFIKLPIGSIEPGGWLKKYLELQRDGLTGKLNEISIWLDKKNNGWFSGNGTGDRGWEEVPYWLKGYGDLGYVLGDKKILAETMLWLEKVLQSQRPDGSFGPMAIEKSYLNSNQGNNPDLWPNMIMIWCLQSYYEYSNDPRVIPFMTNYFIWQATIPENKLLKLYWENSRGGDDLYSIYWLYNRTGEDWLLDLAKKVHHNTADWTQKDRLPNWHNVNIAQCFREPATWYMQSKDSAHMGATYNNFHLIRNLYGQVPGGMFGADENARPGYSDPRQAIEVCGMVEQMSSDEMLTGITGDPIWADNCENVAFNTYPAAVTSDFKALRYLTAPNMVVSDATNHAPGIDNSGPEFLMNPFLHRCCQHNHAQGWPYYAEHLWMATPDNGLVAILYGEGTVTAKVADGKTVSIHEETHYPFDEKIRFELHMKEKTRFPLYLRIPSWCDSARFYVNGKLMDMNSNAASYTIIEINWNDKDVVELFLPQKLSLSSWKNNKNSVTVNYGALSFSLKITENYKTSDSRSYSKGEPKWQSTIDAAKWPSYEITPGSNWNYGLLLSGADSLSNFKIVKKNWPADNFPFSQENVPLEIRAFGKQIPQWSIDQYGLCGILPQSPVVADGPVDSLVLIPMGSARLRISSFPVIKNQN